MAGLTVTVSAKGKSVRKLDRPVEVPISCSAAQFHKILAERTSLSPHRLRVTTLGLDENVVVPKDDNITLANALMGATSVQVKDLGLQIGWRTVFIVEYLGSIIIHPLLYAVQFGLLGGNASFQPTTLQTLTLAMVVLHFLKREFETIYVHHFSSPTMPLFNLFKNSGHYWILSGLLIALEAYSPYSLISASKLSPEDDSVSSTLPLIGLICFIVGESFNFAAHLRLRSLRPAGSRIRVIPTGFPLFDVVTCPNYMFEILAWIGICLVSRSAACVLFTVVASTQMWFWAKKKEAGYRKEFEGKYHRKRWVLFAPFL